MSTHQVFGLGTVLIGLSFGLASALGDEKNEQGDYWLGLACREPTAALRAQTGLGATEGLLVYGVAPQGPGQKAGVELYDIILSVNGNNVGKNTTLSVAWRNQNEQPVRVELLRQSKIKVLRIQPQRRAAATGFSDPRAGSTGDSSDEPPPHGVNHPYLRRVGLELATISEEAKKQLPSPYTGGVAVVNVPPDSLCWMAGIKKGDIIVALDHWRIRDVKDVRYVLDEHKGFNKFFLVRPSETGSTTLYGQLEWGIGVVGGAGPKIAMENTISELASERIKLLGAIAEMEMSILEAKLSLIIIPANNNDPHEVEEQRKRAAAKQRQLEDRKKYFEGELLIVESKVALAKRLFAGWQGEK